MRMMTQMPRKLPRNVCILDIAFYIWLILRWPSLVTRRGSLQPHKRRCCSRRLVVVLLYTIFLSFILLSWTYVSAATAQKSPQQAEKAGNDKAPTAGCSVYDLTLQKPIMPLSGSTPVVVGPPAAAAGFFLKSEPYFHFLVITFFSWGRRWPWEWERKQWTRWRWRFVQNIKVVFLFLILFSNV